MLWTIFLPYWQAVVPCHWTGQKACDGAQMLAAMVNKWCEDDEVRKEETICLVSDPLFPDPDTLLPFHSHAPSSLLSLVVRNQDPFDASAHPVALTAHPPPEMQRPCQRKDLISGSSSGTMYFGKMIPFQSWNCISSYC